MTKKKENESTFEAGMVELEEIISTLNAGDMDLDQSLTAFEQGVRLVKNLNRKLDEAEKRLEVLMKNQQGGFTTVEFIMADEDGEES